MKRNLQLLIVSTVLGLCIAEGALTLMGWQPGQFQYNQWVTKVDSLHELQGLRADLNGVFKVDTAVSLAIVKAVNTDEYALNNSGWYYSQNNFYPEVGSAIVDPMLNDEELEPGYRNLRTQLISEGCATCFDSLFLHYDSIPINEEGFYSIPFNTSCRESPRVLIVGDSFCWGHTTSNKTKSFANHLLTKGYLVFNTGISGSDVAQYKNVIDNYVDVVNPDIILVNVFLGNDIQSFERSPLPNVPIHFTTNAGNLLSFQNGVQYTSAEDAYQNIMNNMVIPIDDNLNRICSKTVVGTILWTGLVRLGLVTANFTATIEEPEIPETRSKLLEIGQICERKQTPVVFSVIANYHAGTLRGADYYPEVFQGLEVVEPNMTLEDYSTGDGHYNDQGHLVYANFLDSIIKAELQNE